MWSHRRACTRHNIKGFRELYFPERGVNRGSGVEGRGVWVTQVSLDRRSLHE